MRRITLVVLLISLVIAGTPAQGGASGDIVITGSGWGHGVGMSQYGAKGMAATGSSAAQILGHYYSGTSVGTVNSSTVKAWIVEETRPLWVGLMQNETTVTFKPVGGGATLCFESSGTTDCLPTAAGAGELWRFRVIDGSTCTYEHRVDGAWEPTGSTGPCNGAVTPNGSASLSFVYIGRTYHDGVLRLRKDPDGAGVHAVWQTALERYVKGILEVPSSWPTAALRAQAMAARSYAVARIGWRGSATSFSSARKASCWCNLYATTYDQQFKGVAAETNAWVSAVNATAGKIVVSGGTAAETFYSSSSGGKTESNQHYWGSGPISYLQTVDDAAAHTEAAGNPHSSWSVSIAPATLAGKLGFDTVTRVQVLERYPSGSPSKIEVVGTKGGKAVKTHKTGKDLRSLLGLRSQYISVDWSAATSTTTTKPSTTTTTQAETTTTTSSSTTTTSPESTSSTAPPSTTTTIADTTTTTTTPDEGEPVEVETPDGPETAGPAPITNEAPEPVGTPEPVAPPPPPAPEPEPTPTIPWEERIDELTFSAADFEPTAAATPDSASVERPSDTTVDTEPPAQASVEPDPVTIDAPPEPSPVRKVSYEMAAEFGSWLARVMDRLTERVVALGADRGS